MLMVRGFFVVASLDLNSSRMNVGSLEYCLITRGSRQGLFYRQPLNVSLSCLNFFPFCGAGGSDFGQETEGFFLC